MLQSNLLPSWARLPLQFLIGTGYLGLVCVAISSGTKTSCLVVAAEVGTAIFFTFAAILVWLTSRAVRRESRQGQFSIATMLFLTFLAAAYLSVIRVLAGQMTVVPGNPPPFIQAAILCGFLSGMSAPFLLILMDSFVWLAAWIVRRPWIQRRLRRLRAKNTQ